MNSVENAKGNQEWVETYGQQRRIIQERVVDGCNKIQELNIPKELKSSAIFAYREKTQKILDDFAKYKNKMFKLRDKMFNQDKDKVNEIYYNVYTLNHQIFQKPKEEFVKLILDGEYGLKNMLKYCFYTELRKNGLIPVNRPDYMELFKEQKWHGYRQAVLTDKYLNSIVEEEMLNYPVKGNHKEFKSYLYNKILKPEIQKDIKSIKNNALKTTSPQLKEYNQKWINNDPSRLNVFLKENIFTEGMDTPDSVIIKNLLGYLKTDRFKIMNDFDVISHAGTYRETEFEFLNIKIWEKLKKNYNEIELFY